MKDQEGNYYLDNPFKRVVDFCIGFFGPIVLIIVTFPILGSFPSGYNYLFPAILLDLAALVVLFVTSKGRRYLRVGLLSLIVLTVVLPGSCFVGFYGGASVASIGGSSGHLSGLSEGLFAAGLAIVFVGLPLTVMIIKKLLRKVSGAPVAEDVSNVTQDEIAAASTTNQSVIVSPPQQQQSATPNSNVVPTMPPDEPANITKESDNETPTNSVN